MLHVDFCLIFNLSLLSEQNLPVDQLHIWTSKLLLLSLGGEKRAIHI